MVSSNIDVLKGLDIAEKDNKQLCDWGIHNKVKGKKLTTDLEESYRTLFRRDRDRILYSGGFRRLQDKTQVMSAVKDGDHRTRLTHTLEVEQIAVSIADALKLNKDLTSAIALGHDVGHTPFGHAVERFLNKELKNEGGFSHALQSVSYLVKDGNKMKLSNEIIEGILKHDTDSFTYTFSKGNEGYLQVKDKDSYFSNEAPGTLEAQVVYWSDKIAYLTHDFEDFHKNRFLDEALENDNDSLKKKLEESLGKLVNKTPDLKDKDELNDITRDLIRNIIQDLVNESSKRIRINLKNKIDKNDNESKQTIIREKTNELIREKYEEDDEYKLLEKIKVKNLKDLTQEDNKEYINKLNDYYDCIVKKEEHKNIKDIKDIMDKIKKINNNLRDKKSLKKELEKEEKSKCFIKKVENLEKLNKYRELAELEVNFFEKRKNTIKQEAYKNGLIINLSNDIMEGYDELRSIINDYYILSQRIQLSDAKAKRIVESLFEMYCSNTNILPIEFKDKIDKEGLNKKRIIADHISSMTDRYAEKIYMDLNSTGSHYDY